MYHVLQDFTAWAKASGYIVAGIAMLGFIPFWFFLSGKQGKRR